MRGFSHALVATMALTLGAIPRSQSPPPATREFRGVWVATVSNIDWPSKKGLSVADQQQELTAILDRARALHLNAIILQVRAACDAFYPSPHEPWSQWLTGTEGKAPEPLWDPLQSAVEGAHARGLELHAWFNPFRARHEASRSPNAESHVTRSTDLCVDYGDFLWLDPGRPAARERTLRAIIDVVTRYDIDGVHIDDYFYPYPKAGIAFPDDLSFAAAQRAGYRGTRANWRRNNVDQMVEGIARAVRDTKPWVKFGISPFGIARPGLPVGIKAGIDQFDQLYADVQKWLREGWCDYLSPQLYWPIAQEKQSYGKLLAWWCEVNPKGRHLWIGNYTGKSGTAGWEKGELVAQIALTRAERGATGNVHFSMKALLHDRDGVATALRNGPYAERALVPASPWLSRQTPPAPSVRAEDLPDGSLRLHPTASGDQEIRFFALYTRSGSRWQLADVRGGDVTFTLPARPEAYAITAIDRVGNESAAAR